MGWADSFADMLAKYIAERRFRCAPEFNPNPLNSDPTYVANNNCYNYACDLRTDTIAQPGRAHGFDLWAQYDMTCALIRSAAIKDGLLPVDSPDACGCANCSHVVALRIAPGKIINLNHDDPISRHAKEQLAKGNPGGAQLEAGDFHWLRRDNNGLWSHKPGSRIGSMIQNLDTPKLHVITDPATADLGIYTHFCGYFCVDKTKVTIK